ncbi:MAG: hypothetical protein JWO37_1750 [Acidimicrobiales bacterium]|jgi:hypothetical protein|nr:hypothetical protein [Acidimicrobiales bacterium]
MNDSTLFGAPVGGIVGRRQLIAVQTIELGRLTHHPVPLVPSALVAVSGTGPERDSNGSGKTTFLASVSLLLGDPEWRVATTGGADALGLLFDPDLSGDAAGLYDPARVGYVAGVFAHMTADGSYDELTVWVRISSDDSPRLAARWAPGVHLVAERDEAAAMWNSLGRERQIGPTAFVEQLYGGTGRCLAYVTSRGNRDTDTSLMQLQARLSPARIGSELIVLLGLEHLIDGERDLRAKLADAQQRLAVRIDDHERREREWAATLTEIDARDSARAAITDGKRLWRLRLARKLLDALSEQQQAEAQLTELSSRQQIAESAVRDLEARLADLPDAAALAEVVESARRAHEDADARHTTANEDVVRRRLELEQLAQQISALTTKALAAPPGISPEECDGRVADTTSSLDRAVRTLGAVEVDLQRANATLAAITEHGDSDPRARAALDAAQTDATSLIDGIVLEDTARQLWEPLLAPWRGAFVIPSHHRDRAIAAAPPGTVLVIVEPDMIEQPPDGVTEAPAGTARFLETLLGRSDAPYVDVAAGVVVTGGFEHELCGRDAAIARAHAEVERVERAHADEFDNHERARLAHELAIDVAERVHVAEELATVRLEESERSQAMAGFSHALADADGVRTAAITALLEARVQHETATQGRDRLNLDLEASQEEVARVVRDLQVTHAAIERLDINGWRRAWADTDEAAAAALDGDDRPEDSLRRRATEQLGVALERVGIDSTTGDRAPTPAIESVIRARRGLDDDVAPTNEVRRFDTVAQPLVDWLDDQSDHDTTFREDVAAERQRWEELIGAARHECETQGDLLDRHRDMVEQQIEATLGHVSARYGELDATAGGYGAKLHWRSIRPVHPTDLWVWEVTPEWRRGHGAKWLAYTRQANSAMQKQHRTHLVLAALLAAQDPAGRVLIVDEAGNDFGREHLRQVLSAFAHVADAHGVTVIAACQDKVLEEVAALGAARLLLWFERLSDASALCRPTRVWGFDADGRRVELTRSAVEAGRQL